ncbi:iron-sulfur cluster repair di-iron protein [Aquimarina rhabdastrellae]
MDILPTHKIGDIVALNYKTAAIFSSYNIDFCCKGQRTLFDACTTQNVPIEELIFRLKSVVNSTSYDEQEEPYKDWSPVVLIDHILNEHHSYVEETIPVLLQYLNKLCKVHGERHPELFQINNLFIQAANELMQHMQKEEMILFPFVRAMHQAITEQTEIPLPHFGTVENPIRMMQHEHDNEGERFRKIAALSNQFTPPVDACTTYRVTYAMLSEFEKDLHKHIHLENNILFPKAIDQEHSLNLVY